MWICFGVIAVPEKEFERGEVFNAVTMVAT
jgi:hypothetical protein